MNLLFWYRSLMRSVSAALVKLIVTATSGLVSFTTNVIRQVKVTCEFSPVQEGTGDPSPDNVRPISGWTGANIYRASNNILMPKDDNGYYPTFIKAGTQVATSVYSPSSRDTVRYYRQDKTQVTYMFIQGTADDEGYKTRLYTATEDIYYVKFDQGYPNPQVNFGNVRLPYNEPSATSLPITFTDPTTGDPLTVYGGTVTLNEDGSADLVEDWYHFVVDGVQNRIGVGSTKTIDGVSYHGDYHYLKETANKHITGTRWLTDTVICSNCLAANKYPSNISDVFVYVNYNYWYVFVRDDLLSEVSGDAINAYLQEHPVTFSGKALSGYFTPNVYHFDNIGQLITFIGTNNIWHNMNGDITVEYWNKQ